MDKLISVIVPVYKVEKYLDRCVESIVNQTYKNLEIILVDDGSPDNCPAMCDKWAERDERIKVIHKENGGLSSARNAGLDLHSGEWIYFIDSDDEIKPYTIEELYETATDNDCDMAMGRFIRAFEDEDIPSDTEFSNELMLFDEDGFWEYYSTKINDIESIDISVSMIISCNKLIKSVAFDGLRFDEGKKNEDEFIIHKIVSKCEKIAFADRLYYLYYQVNGSIMHSSNQTPCFDYVEAFKRRAEYFAENKKSYTSLAFLCCADELAYNILCYRATNPGLSEALKKDYSYMLRLSKPYLGGLSLIDRLYYSSLLYNYNLFRLMRKIRRLIKRL